MDNKQVYNDDAPRKQTVVTMLTSASWRLRAMLQLTGESLCASPVVLKEALVSPVPTGPTRSPI